MPFSETLSQKVWAFFGASSASEKVKFLFYAKKINEEEIFEASIQEANERNIDLTKIKVLIQTKRSTNLLKQMANFT